MVRPLELLTRPEDSSQILIRICNGINKLQQRRLRQIPTVCPCNQDRGNSREVLDRENHLWRTSSITIVSVPLSTKDNSVIFHIRIYKDIKVLGRTWVVLEKEGPQESHSLASSKWVINQQWASTQVCQLWTHQMAEDQDLSHKVEAKVKLLYPDSFLQEQATKIW